MMGGYGFGMFGFGFLGWILNLVVIGFVVYLAVKLAMRSNDK